MHETDARRKINMNSLTTVHLQRDSFGSPIILADSSWFFPKLSVKR